MSTSPRPSRGSGPLRPLRPLPGRPSRTSRTSCTSLAHLALLALLASTGIGPACAGGAGGAGRSGAGARGGGGDEVSLLEAARAAHTRATEARVEFEVAASQDAERRMGAGYRDAIAAYRRLLRAFPRGAGAYDATYALAECLYFGGERREAAETFRKVAAHPTGRAHREEALLGAAQALETLLEEERRAGRIAEPPMPDAAAVRAARRPLAVPPPVAELRAAYDAYVAGGADEARRAQLALAAALISYRHLELDDALVRFEAILARHCKTREAAEAKEGVLVIARGRGDERRFVATNERFVQGGCGASGDGPAAASDAETARLQNLGIRFEGAVALERAGKHAEAARRFQALAREAPPDDPNRDDALFAAAAAWERAKRPAEAVPLYAELEREPAHRASEYRLEAIFRSAALLAAGGDGAAAVAAYLRFLEAAGAKGAAARPAFDLARARRDALWNAALLREQAGVLRDAGRKEPGAATLFRRYAEAEGAEPARAAEALFRAGLAFGQGGDPAGMAATFRTWRERFGRDPAQAPWVVRSHLEEGRALEAAGKGAQAEAAYREAVAAFDRLGEAPGGRGAPHAAEAQFLLAERVYRGRFESHRPRWGRDVGGRDAARSQRAVDATLGELQALIGEASAGYVAVSRYRSTWSVAALVRLGDVSFFAGQKLLDAEPPRAIAEEERRAPGALARFREQIEAIARPVMDEGRGHWRKAADAPGGGGPADEWRKQAGERLRQHAVR